MKGYCIHGEFDLETGCEQCVADRMTSDVANSFAEAVAKSAPESPPPGPMIFIEKGYPPSVPDTQATININPELAPFYLQLKEEVERLQVYSETVKVTNLEESKRVTNDLALIARLTKAIEERRKEYTVPLNDYLGQFNNAFRKLSEPLKKAENTTKSALLSYQKAMEDARKKAEEEAAIARAEAARKSEEIKRETGEIVEIEPEQVELPPEATTKVRTDLGTVSQTDNWKYEIIDKTLIPAEYWIVDEVKLGKIVRAGIRDIPGLRIYNDTGLRTRT